MIAYRRSVFRIRAACHAAAVVSLFVALYAFAVDLPVAGVLAAFLSLTSLRLAFEARQEIDRWPRRCGVFVFADREADPLAELTSWE